MTESDVSVLKIPEADENRINMDKENVLHPIVANKITELCPAAYGPRIPLQSINHGRGGVHRPIYSPITPVSGARSQTPRSKRKSKTPHDRRKTVSGYRPIRSPLNVMNTLLYNKAKELIEQGLQEERGIRKQLEAAIVEKDNEILMLKAEVNLLSGGPMVASASQDDKSVTASCKTRDELVTDREAFETDNRTLRMNLSSILHKYQLLELELVHAKTVRNDDRLSTDNASEQQKGIADLLACQSRLMQEVSDRETEVASCQSQLQQREREAMMHGESLAKLQDDLSRIYEQKQRETVLCNEYRCQRQKDIERLLELEARLDEFAKIQPSIISARLEQEKFADVIRKAHQTVLENNRRVVAEREEFLKQKVEWLQWKDEKEQSLAAIQEECDSARKMNERQGRCSQRDLVDESKLDGLLKQIVCLESTVENERRVTHDLTEKLVLAEKQVTSLNEQMAADAERHELEVTNLQRTLDMREHEFDELTKECSNYKRLVAHVNAQATKQQTVIAKVADLEMQIELMAKENKVVCDEVRELRKRSAELQQLTADHQTLVEKTVSLETCLIEKEQQIQCKEAELSHAVIAVELLSKKASSFYDELTSRWKAWNRMSQGEKAETETPHRRRSQARTPVTSNRRRSRKSFGAPSFVFQILSASKQNAIPCGKKTTPVLKMYDTATEGESSRDHVVIGRDEPTELTTREPESEIPLPTIRRGSQDSNCSDGAEVISLHSSSSSSYGERFTSFVDEIATVLTKVESLLHGEVTAAFSQLQNLVKSLNGHLAQQQQLHARQMKEAKAVVHEAVAEAGEEKRKAEIAMQRSTHLEDELKEKTEHANRLAALIQTRHDQLIQLSDQSSEITRMSRELASAQNKCELQDEEIRLLESSLGERWQRIEAANPDTRTTVIKGLEKEVISLRMQKQKLMQEHVDDRRKWEESTFRLTDEHRTDTRHLRKAEEAIGQLDEKIERIRLALQPHLNLLITDEKLHPILREIRAFD